jgi:predicted ATPase with chaperone activity
VGVLLASKQIFGNLDGAIMMCELSLDGGVRHVSGVLPMAVMARDEGYRTLFVPAEDAAEASLIAGLRLSRPQPASAGGPSDRPRPPGPLPARLLIGRPG